MSTYRSHLDSISVTVSLLCVIHCVLLPILLTTLPLWGFEVLENSYIEFGTILISLVAGGWAIWKGYWKYHHHISILLLFVSGIGVMITANFTEKEFIEMILKGIGAMLIVTSHIMNWKGCRRCIVCETERTLNANS